MADRAKTLDKKRRAEFIDALNRWLVKVTTDGTVPPDANQWISKYSNPDSEELFKRALDILGELAPFRSVSGFLLCLHAEFEKSLPGLLAELDPAATQVDSRLLSERIAEGVTGSPDKNQRQAQLAGALRRWLENRLPELKDILVRSGHFYFHLVPEGPSAGTLPPEIVAIMHRWFATCRYLNPDKEELFKTALDILGGSASFRSESDFWLSLNGSFESGLRSLGAEELEASGAEEPGSTTQAGSQDVQTILQTNPFQDRWQRFAARLAAFIARDIEATTPFNFRFTFPATTGTAFPPVGQPQRLEVRCDGYESESDAWHVVATGKVDACTVFGARDAVCDLLREFVGAALAIGLAGLDVDCPETREADAVGIEFPCSDLQCDLPHSVSVTGGLNRALRDIRFVMPANAGSIDHRTWQEADQAKAIRALSQVVAGSDDRAKQLQSAARLLFWASTAEEPGMASAFAMMCVEALLLEPRIKEDNLARFKEAVANRLGKSRTERQELRNQAEKLYDLRSKYVHTGEIPEKMRAVALKGECVELAREVLRHEIDEGKREVES